MSADTAQAVQALKFYIDNRLVRFILKRFISKCERDGKSRLEVALELFSGVRDDACFICKHVAHPLVSRIIARSGGALGASEEAMKEKFKDPYWRRGLVSVIKGIVKYGVRKPFTPGAPFLIVWDITARCNLRCKHCYSTAGAPLPRELSTEEALKVVRDLADMGVAAIAFSGGEPLLRPDFFEIVNAVRDNGIFPALATNATLITREVAKKLKEAGVGFVQISLDGANAATHDSFRGVKGAFERTVAGIRNCVNEGLFVEVSCTITRFNYAEVDQILDLCEELGVNWFMMFNFIPTGRGRFIVENDLSPEEREEVLRKLWKRMKSSSSLSVLSTAPQFARVALQAEEVDMTVVPTHFYNMNLPGRLRSLSEFVGGCGAGRCYAAIEPEGDIQPCVFFPLTVGNVRESPFSEVWDTSEVFWDLRDREKLKGGCGSCQYKYVCGGCRARAYGYFGDYLAPDPGCIINAKDWRELTANLEVKRAVEAKIRETL
ncbi:MAG: radical SAM/SPASM domain-containing protein [Thermoprotei archaeon]|nr:MAG: radical SAM/SPASM domain-containing protein [Thermoprotei archaeon]